MPDWLWPLPRTRVSRDDLRDSLNQYSREPFGDVLEALLQARPSTEQLLQWAARDPAQWANAIKIFSLLNGYTEKTESLTVHKHLHLHKLSDAELLQETQKMIHNDPSLLEELRAIDKKSVQTFEQKSGSNIVPISSPAPTSTQAPIIDSDKINPFLDSDTE